MIADICRIKKKRTQSSSLLKNFWLPMGCKGMEELAKLKGEGV